MREPLLLHLYHYRPIRRAVIRYIESIPHIIWGREDRRAVKHAQYLMDKYGPILDDSLLYKHYDQVKWIVFVFRQIDSHEP